LALVVMVVDAASAAESPVLKAAATDDPNWTDGRCARLAILGGRRCRARVGHAHHLKPDPPRPGPVAGHRSLPPPGRRPDCDAGPGPIVFCMSAPAFVPAGAHRDAEKGQEPPPDCSGCGSCAARNRRVNVPGPSRPAAFRMARPTGDEPPSREEGNARGAGSPSASRGK
jgi:hypothetical protein